MFWDVIVVGAGAAGYLAGVAAAERGRRTLMLEKNRKAGVKILMSGGTRCNLTHATDRRGIVERYGKAGRFLHSALAALGPQELVALFEAEGVATKVEETGKVFPVSDRALDVLRALEARRVRSGCELALEEGLRELQVVDREFRLVTTQRELTAGSVILTTGGKSYPGCGTTGDGYAWAASLGHTIVPPRPALVPLRINVPWVNALRGLTIADVAVRVLEPEPVEDKTRGLGAARGSFLFTHFGLSGPVILDVSREVTAHRQPASLRLECDFLPGETSEAFAERLRSASTIEGKKSVSSIWGQLLPRRLAEQLLVLAEISPEKKGAELSKVECSRLVQLTKRLTLPIAGTLGFEKAEVTAGGVALDEVDSRTMQSRLVPGLFIAGELLDLDGPIGGFNFQAAFSTGYLAGQSA